MTEKSTVVLVNIESVQEWFAASSEDLHGFFMAHDDLGELISDIPEAIKVLYKTQHGLDVDVRSGGHGDSKQISPLRYIMETAHAA